MKVLRAIGRGIAALLGVGFVCAAYLYLTLPDVRPLRVSNPSLTAFMDLRAREAHAQGLPVKRDWIWVPYARISANLKKAVIVTEDGAFWQHDGMDYEQLRESIEVNWSAANSRAAPAPSPSSWPRTSTSPRRRTRSGK